MLSRKYFILLSLCTVSELNKKSQVKLINTRDKWKQDQNPPKVMRYSGNIAQDKFIAINALKINNLTLQLKKL